MIINFRGKERERERGDGDQRDIFFFFLRRRPKRHDIERNLYNIKLWIIP